MWPPPTCDRRAWGIVLARASGAWWNSGGESAAIRTSVGCSIAAIAAVSASSHHSPSTRRGSTSSGRWRRRARSRPPSHRFAATSSNRFFPGDHLRNQARAIRKRPVVREAADQVAHVLKRLGGRADNARPTLEVDLVAPHPAGEERPAPGAARDASGAQRNRPASARRRCYRADQPTQAQQGRPRSWCSSGWPMPRSVASESAATTPPPECCPLPPPPPRSESKSGSHSPPWLPAPP